MNVATLSLLIPPLGMSDVRATVPAELGKVIGYISCGSKCPIKVTAFVPLFVSSFGIVLNSSADDEPDKTGAVNVLLVKVAVDDVDNKRASPPVLW